MELILIRHALPERIDGVDGGPAADPGLAERGDAQAVRVVDALAGEEIDAIYVSPAARAQQTAAPLVEARRLQPTTDPGIAEFDVTSHSYVPVEELKAAGDPRYHALARGEIGIDPEQFRDRVVTAVESIADAHAGQRVVLVSHSGAINAYLGHVLGQSRALWFAPAYASISRVAARRDGRRGILSLNETQHVRDLLT